MLLPHRLTRGFGLGVSAADTLPLARYCKARLHRNGTFFTNLNQLSAGDKVKITDKRGEVHIYEVADTSVIDPYDNTVKNQSDEEILTLLTCANKGTKRFVCRCIPVKEAGDVDE